MGVDLGSWVPATCLALAVSEPVDGSFLSLSDLKQYVRYCLLLFLHIPPIEIYFNRDLSRSIGLSSSDAMFQRVGDLKIGK